MPGPVPCRYSDCMKSFKTEGEMIAHLVEEPAHDYCELCDVCSEDYVGHMRHLAQSERHIACPSCAEEFKSVGGMERHIKQAHRAVQKLTCYGCHVIFRSAGDMVGHLEKGLCRNSSNPKQSITQANFRDHINQKTIINRIINNSEQGNSVTGPYGPGSMGSNDTAGPERGGILLDSPSTEAASTPALQPTPGAQRPQVTTTTTPSGPASASSNRPPNINNINNIEKATNSISSLSIGNPTPAEAARNPTSKAFNKNSSTSSTGASGGSASTNGSNAPAWKNGPSSAVLTKPEGDESKSFAVGLRNLDAEYAAQHTQPGDTNYAASIGNGSIGPNDWNTRFWNPRSEQWDPSRFLNSLIGVYECPHKECNYSDVSVMAFTSHCFDAHVPRVFRCPSCLREYKNLQALVQHCESPSHKCHIRKSRDYAQFMAYITGGFIDAQNKNEKGEVLYSVNKPAEFADRTKEPGFW